MKKTKIIERLTLTYSLPDAACCYGVPVLKTAVTNIEAAVIRKETDNIRFLMVELNKEIIRLKQYVQKNKKLLDFA